MPSESKYGDTTPIPVALHRVESRTTTGVSEKIESNGNDYYPPKPAQAPPQAFSDRPLTLDDAAHQHRCLVGRSNRG